MLSKKFLIKTPFNVNKFFKSKFFLISIIKLYKLVLFLIFEFERISNTLMQIKRKAQINILFELNFKKTTHFLINQDLRFKPKP